MWVLTFIKKVRRAWFQDCLIGFLLVQFLLILSTKVSTWAPPLIDRLSFLIASPTIWNIRLPRLTYCVHCTRVFENQKVAKDLSQVAKNDADCCHAHIYTAMRSLHTHTCTHTTCTAIQSLLLHTPTQRYDRCHCTHLDCCQCTCQHNDTIAVSEHTSTAMQSLFPPTRTYTAIQ